MRSMIRGEKEKPGSIPPHVVEYPREYLEVIHMGIGCREGISTEWCCCMEPVVIGLVICHDDLVFPARQQLDGSLRYFRIIWFKEIIHIAVIEYQGHTAPLNGHNRNTFRTPQERIEHGVAFQDGSLVLRDTM